MEIINEDGYKHDPAPDAEHPGEEPGDEARERQKNGGKYVHQSPSFFVYAFRSFNSPSAARSWMSSLSEASILPRSPCNRPISSMLSSFVMWSLYRSNPRVFSFWSVSSSRSSVSKTSVV